MWATRSASAPSRLGGELVEAAEQLVVGDGMEREFGVHENNIGRGFGASQEDERLHQRANLVARGSLRDCAARGARRCVTRGFTRASLGARKVAPESCQGVAEKKLHRKYRNALGLRSGSGTLPCARNRWHTKPRGSSLRTHASPRIRSSANPLVRESARQQSALSESAPSRTCLNPENGARAPRTQVRSERRKPLPGEAQRQIRRAGGTVSFRPGASAPRWPFAHCPVAARPEPDQAL